MSKINREKTNKAKLIVICWTKMIYGILIQRNKKMSAATNQLVTNVKNIIFKSASRASSSLRELLIR